jgi:hypothetical protein
MTVLRYACAVGALLFSAQAWAAECVNVTLRDENGLSRKTDAPVIGMIIPGLGPIVNQTLPPMTSVEPGLPAECPADLIAAVQDIFNQSCLSEETRKQAAETNGLGPEDVNARCQAMYSALNKK